MEMPGAGGDPPWLTYALLAALTAVFACEIFFGLDPPTGLGAPSVSTLVMLGGSSRYLVVADGEWYRVVSAAFLHAGVIHLALNGFALLWAGPLLEGLAGRAWFAAVYGVSAVTGSIVSLALNPPSVVSIGASGALMGLDACLLLVSFHFDGPMRAHVQRVTLLALLTGLVPMATAAAGRIDVFSHLGGMLGGALIGLILLGNWPEAARLPRLRWLAGVIAAAGLAAAVLTLSLVVKSVARGRHEQEMRALHMPNNQLPRTEAEMKSQMESLSERYPRDPRLRLSRGTAMLNTGDLSGAERELRAGLADAEIMTSVLPAQVEATLRTNLATALHRTRQDTMAKVVAGPVCGRELAESAPLRARLKSLGICE
jgi:rhomboid protease GluP